MCAGSLLIAFNPFGLVKKNKKLKILLLPLAKVKNIASGPLLRTPVLDPNSESKQRKTPTFKGPLYNGPTIASGPLLDASSTHTKHIYKGERTGPITEHYSSGKREQRMRGRKGATSHHHGIEPTIKKPHPLSSLPACECAPAPPLAESPHRHVRLVLPRPFISLAKRQKPIQNMKTTPPPTTNSRRREENNWRLQKKKKKK